MKLNSTIAAIVLGLGTASVASATNYIYFTGSTAARAAVYNSLHAGVGFDGGVVSVEVTYGNATPGNCSYMEFGGNIGGNYTLVKCTWSGSEAGIADVSGSGTESFLADPGTSGVISSGNSASSPTAGQLVTSTVNLAMADNSLTYSQTPGSTAVQQGPVVVIPFVFEKNNTPGIDDSGVGSASWTNITSDMFRTLAGGKTDLGLFINAAPTGYNVYLTGRDILSGTRANTFGYTGYGINRSPNQILLATGAGNPATTSLVLPPGNAAGNYYTSSGQSSGGTLAKTLGDTSNAADLIADSTGSTLGFLVVTYLGLSDAATAEAAPYSAHRLTYNGVTYSAAAVENGTYTAWGNEYILSKAGSASNVTGLQSALAAQLQNHTDSNEIPLSAMHVSRGGPTSAPAY